MKYLFFLIFGIIIGLHFAYRFDIHEHRPYVWNEPVDTTMTCDTVWLHDTVKEPKYVTSIRVRVDTVYFPSAVPPDSVVKPVEIPIEQQEYRGDGWHAWISGYHAALDSLIIDRPTVTIGREVTRWKRKHWGFQAGVGLNVDRHGHVSPGLYAGFGYQF